MPGATGNLLGLTIQRAEAGAPCTDRQATLVLRQIWFRATDFRGNTVGFPSTSSGNALDQAGRQ